MPIESEQFELSSIYSRTTTMDHETRYDPGEQEDERALSEGENNDSTEMSSKYTPRLSSAASARTVLVFSVIYTFLHSMVPLPSVFAHTVPRRGGGAFVPKATTIAEVISAFPVFSLGHFVKPSHPVRILRTAEGSLPP